MKNNVKIKVIKKSDVAVARDRKIVLEEKDTEPTKNIASTVSGWIEEFQTDQRRKI